MKLVIQLFTTVKENLPSTSINIDIQSGLDKEMIKDLLKLLYQKYAKFTAVIAEVGH